MTDNSSVRFIAPDTKCSKKPKKTFIYLGNNVCLSVSVCVPSLRADGGGGTSVVVGDPPPNFVVGADTPPPKKKCSIPPLIYEI